MRFLFSSLFSALFLASVLSVTALSSEIVLELPTSEGNSRNSEGSFITLKNGDILYIYTRFGDAGGDHSGADLCSRISHDGGRTWTDKDAIVVKNYVGMNVMSVSLLRLQDGRIALFYLEKDSETDCRPVLRISTDEGVSWGDVIHIIPDSQRAYYVVNNDRVIQLSSGRILVPLALHRRAEWDKWDRQGTLATSYSDDGGKTWVYPKDWTQGFNAQGERIVTQEPGVVELKDGRVLLFIRTDAGEQYKSYSSDKGASWSVFEPMGAASPVSPASIERLPGSDLLVMVWNDHTAIPMAERKKRTPLSLAVSRDEGMTWSPSMTLEPDPKGWYCYTAMEFTSDALLLAYVAGYEGKGLLSDSRIRRVSIPEMQDLK